MDEIAEALKAQREALGLRHEDIFERTRINPEFLEALEAGQYDVLPETYVRLFLRTYANELGLDANAIVARYETQHPPEKPEPSQPPPQRTQAPMSIIAIGVGAIFVIAIFVIQFSTRQDRETAAPLDTAVAPAKTNPPANVPMLESHEDTPPATTPIPQMPTVVDSSSNTASDQPAEQRIAPAETEMPPQQEAAQIEPPAESPVAETTATAPVDTPPANENVTGPANEPPVTPDPTARDTQNTQVVERVPSDARAGEISAPPAQESIAEPTVYDLPMPAQLTDDQPMVLSGIVRQTTRLRVAADGRSIFSGELRMGSRPRWQARDSFRVQMDQADAIDLSLQGQALSSPQTPNHSIRLLVTRTQIRVEELPPSDAQADANR